MENNSLIVVGRLSYPNNTAACNRVHLYCKSLKLANGSPFIINLHSTFNFSKKISFLGRFDGIPFYFAQRTSVRETRYLKRNAKKIWGFVNTLIVIRRVQKKSNIKVLFFSTTVADEMILSLFLKLWGIKIIREINEAPLFIRKGKQITKLRIILLWLRTIMYDQIIVISDYLYNFYNRFFKTNNIFQIPILVDIDRFKAGVAILNKSGNRMITYVGFMGGNKDGLEDLIDAIAIVKSKINNIHLNLIGSADSKDLERLKKKVENLKLQNTISFLGRKDVSEIPSFLLNSDILVLARPDNDQAKAGFPTKLGEYLASGVPVVITKTGEIPKYLKHQESAYLAEANNIKSIAENISFALEDSNATNIGLKGKQIALKNFDYKLFSERIIAIIKRQ